jgi:PAS domain S-box-containing protein
VYFLPTPDATELELGAAHAAVGTALPRIQVGSGLVGQVAKSGKALLITDVRATLHTCQSALAEVVLAAVRIHPLVYNDVTVGVLELGLTSALPDNQIIQLEHFAEQVAAQWMNIRSQQQVERLLAEARERSEALAAQEEELRQNLEEMHATQEELHRRMTLAEAANRRTEAVLAASVDPIVVIDARGRIQTFSPAAQQLFGYTQAEALGQNVSLLMPAHHAQRHDGYMHNYHTTGETRVMGKNRELEAQRKDGSRFPIELSINQAEIEGQRVYVGVLRDISERKRLQAQMASALNAVDATLPMAEFALDGTIRRANSLFAEAMGYSPEALVGSHHSRLLVGTEAHSPEYALFWEQLLAGIPQTGRFRRCAADGTVRVMDATYTPTLGPGGEVTGVLKLVRSVQALPPNEH